MSQENAPLQQWNAQTYDSKHGFVTEFGNDVLTLLNPQPGEVILDIGCGTGHLTAKIADAGATPIGLDADEAMIQSAQESYPELQWILANAASYRAESPVNAAFSNAALHWMRDISAVFRTTYDNLVPKGRFVFEMGGIGNVGTITGSLREAVKSITGELPEYPLTFLSIGQASQMLESCGFEVISAWLFDRPTPLEGEDGYKNWIAQFGGVMLTGLTPDQREEALAKGEETARAVLYREGQWCADYRRLRVVAIKLA
ncbi:MAG: methyltransferase domain-containing protein [Armatimonadetes bacterium]|nr:methyltransferase domain-containing protein [Armatimonadota bacterium]